MTQITNAFSSYDAVANREDLSDVIYNIDPFDTPIMSAIGRRNVDNRIFDWQTEELPTVDTGNAKPEGDDILGAGGNASMLQAGQPTVRLRNTTQISHRTASVTGSQEASNPAGKNSEMARQIAIKGKALKRDMESILCQKQPVVYGTDGAPTRNTRALEHWIVTNESRGATGADAVSETAVMTDGTQRDLTETLVKDVLQLAYTNGAEPGLFVVGPFNKRVVSKFVGRASATQPVTLQGVDKNEVVQTVSVYSSDFGDLKVIPSRWIRTRTALLLDPEYLAVAYFRSFRTEDLAKIGDGKSKMVLAEWGLEVRNEKAHAAIFDLTTSGAHG